MFLFREFQDATFVREVPQVSVFGVNLLLADAVQRNLVGGSVVDSVFAAMEVPLGVLPRSNDLELRVQGGVGQFETDLVVTLTGSTVGHSVGAFLLGNLHLVLGDERTGERGSQEVGAFVLGASADGGPNVVFEEFLLEVENVALAGASLESLVFEGLGIREVVLTEVGGESDHFAIVVFLEPGDDDTRIESTAIGEDHFFLGFFLSHFGCPFRKNLDATNIELRFRLGGRNDIFIPHFL